MSFARCWSVIWLSSSTLLGMWLTFSCGKRVDLFSRVPSLPRVPSHRLSSYQYVLVFGGNARRRASRIGGLSVSTSGLRAWGRRSAWHLHSALADSASGRTAAWVVSGGKQLMSDWAVRAWVRSSGLKETPEWSQWDLRYCAPGWKGRFSCGFHMYRIYCWGSRSRITALGTCCSCFHSYSTLILLR